MNAEGCSGMGHLVLMQSEKIALSCEPNRPVIVGEASFKPRILAGPVLQLEETRITDDRYVAFPQAREEFDSELQTRRSKRSLTSSTISDLSGQIEQVYFSLFSCLVILLNAT